MSPSTVYILSCLLIMSTGDGQPNILGPQKTHPTSLITTSQCCGAGQKQPVFSADVQRVKCPKLQAYNLSPHRMSLHVVRLQDVH